MQGLRPKRSRAWSSDAKDKRESRAVPGICSVVQAFNQQSYTVSHTEYCAQANVSETHQLSFAHRAVVMVFATRGSFP